MGVLYLFWQQSHEKSGYESIWNPLRSAAKKVPRAQECCQQCKLTFLLYIHCNISSVMMQTPCSVPLVMILKRFCCKAQFNIICLTNISKTQSNNFKLIHYYFVRMLRLNQRCKMKSRFFRKFEEEREKHQVCSSQLEIEIHVFCVAKLSVALGVEKGLPRFHWGSQRNQGKKFNLEGISNYFIYPHLHQLKKSVREPK